MKIHEFFTRAPNEEPWKMKGYEGSITTEYEEDSINRYISIVVNGTEKNVPIRPEGTNDMNGGDLFEVLGLWIDAGMPSRDVRTKFTGGIGANWHKDELIAYINKKVKESITADKLRKIIKEEVDKFNIDDEADIGVDRIEMTVDEFFDYHHGKNWWRDSEVLTGVRINGKLFVDMPDLNKIMRMFHKNKTTKVVFNVEDAHDAAVAKFEFAGRKYELEIEKDV
jgi:hypothetical protein